MANLSNINNKFLFTDGDFLKIGNLAPINNISSTESGISVINSNVASLSLTSTAATGKTYTLMSEGPGGFRIRDIDANSDRLIINTSGNATFAGEISAGQRIKIGSGGTYEAGSIYSDSNYGMIFRALQASPSTADFLFTNSANVARLTIDSSGNSTFAGNVTVGADAAGHDVMFRGGTSGAYFSYDASEDGVVIVAPTDEVALGIRVVGGAQPTVPQFTVGRGTSQYLGIKVDDRISQVIHRQDETDAGIMQMNQEIWDSGTGVHKWNWISADGAGASASTKMTLNKTGDLYLPVGNVGIGTTSPECKLTVADSGSGGGNPSTISSNTVATFRRTGGVSHNANISILAGTSGASILNFGDRDNEDAGIITYTHDSGGSDTMAFTVGTSEKMRIINSGNVGIGTTSPGYKLNVINNNTATWTARFTNNTNNVYLSVNDANNYGIYVSGETKNYFSGNVGIGTTSPSARLHVYTQTGNPTVLVGRGSGQSSIKASADADGGYLALDSSGNGLILNHYSSDNVWLVTGGGNVGVGNTGPSQKLHITGNLRVTGAYYDSNNSAGTSGQVLSSTASGTDWVDVLTGSGTSGVLPKWNSAGTALIDSGLSFPSPYTYADFVLGASGTTTVRFIGNASSTGDFSIKNTTGDIYLQANNTTATTAKFTTSSILLNEDTTISGYLRVQGSTSSNLYIGNVFGPSDTNTGYRINHSSLGCFIDVRNDVDKIIYRDYPDAVGTINSRFEMNMSTGTFTASGNIIAYGSPSDKRLKENIKPIESALDKVSKLQGVTFNWKKSDSILNIKEDVGFIAQDVQKVIPELVREDKDGMLSMRHQGITPILLEAIKELKAEIEELKLNKCNCNK